MVSLAFITALVVRVAWNVIPAMNASGTGLWDMSGGSDPWYMKRVVDYVIAERSHLIFDHDRAYPTGGINPRPPLFSWSLALGGSLYLGYLRCPQNRQYGGLCLHSQQYMGHLLLSQWLESPRVHIVGMRE